MQSKAQTVDQYIGELPEERRQVFTRLLSVIRENLPAGFTEGMSYGMPGWVVPHSIYPKGYHCDPKLPLPFLSIASQKNHIALYHLGLYKGELLDWFLNEWQSAGLKKPDIGKSCIRFKKEEDIPFMLIGKLASKMDPHEWISAYEKNLR